MIDAREVIRTLRLPEQDEVEVQRLGAEIVAVIRGPKFDGRPIPVVIPAGDTDEERDRAYRIVCALKRRFEANLWSTQLETYSDAVGAPSEHRLWLSVDAQAVRGAVQAALARRENGAANGKTKTNGQKPVEVVTPLVDASIQPVPEKPTLSVILGTYNRLSHLQEAIRSARKAAGDLAVEFVVADGGSSDGSREWLCAQPDVVFLGLKRLEGAVPAFNSAFREARGLYIANYNDDSKYGENVLVEGVKYLREHPECGQVAFGLSNHGQVIVNEVYPKAQYPNAPPSTYANFGIIRRSIAEKIARIQGGNAFWNPIYKTYCGDTELSAWVWRLGMTVDALPHLVVEDIQAQDELRTKNMELAGAEAKRMYARWPAEAFKPDGPDPRVTPEELQRYYVERERPLEEGAITQPPDDVATMAELCGFPGSREERRVRAIGMALRALDPTEGSFPPRAAERTKERVLHVSLNTSADPQAAQVRALQMLGSEGYKEIRWFADYGQDSSARQKAILDATFELKPSVVFMQLQAPNVVDITTIKKIREISPEAVIVDWGGDIGSYSSIWNLDWMAEFGRMIDLNLHSSMSHVRMMRSLGIHNAAYLNIGFDEMQYRPPLRAPTERNAEGRPVMTDDDTKAVVYGDWRAKFRAYDACFLGNKYENEDAFSKSVKWHDGVLRNEVIQKMKEAFGWKFCLYGTGWGKNVQRMSLSRSHEIYQRSKVGVSISLQNDLEAYTSDRLFRILGCGALLLVKRFAGMSILGLEDGINCLCWNTADEAVSKAKSALDEKTDSIRQAGADLAREHHSWSIRMHELQLLLDVVRKSRSDSRT